MLVTRGNIASVIESLSKHRALGTDTETTGLRMYHGDRIFSIIIASVEEVYYFDFNDKDYHEYMGDITEHEKPLDEFLSKRTHLDLLRPLYSDPNRVWYIANAANFDLGMFGVDDIEISGTVHCTQAIGRVVDNTHMQYGLDAQLQRLGRAKDDRVKTFVKEHKLYTKILKPNGEYYEHQHYDKVPRKIMQPYAEHDGKETLFLGTYQEEAIKKLDSMEPNLNPKRCLQRVVDNERRLSKTVYRMRRQGVLIDFEYVNRALAYEADRAKKATDAFKVFTGRDYLDSGKLYAEVFAEVRDKWSYTDKGNPSFDSDALKKLQHPAATNILEFRDAKSKVNFYQGFIWHRDKDNRVHPNWNQEGVAHGRFSSSSPNFQNLTSEEILFCKKCGHGHEDMVEVCEADGCGSRDLQTPEFLIRRAIIPPPGHVLIMPDYDQMEYKFMLELACILLGYTTPLGEMINKGMDFHKATQENVKNFTGLSIPRKPIKIVNFRTLYGSGIKSLAASLGITYNEAFKIVHAIFSAAPEVKKFIDACEDTAKKRGYVVNWLGRRSYFPNKRFAYRAANYIVSGGCADVNKTALNQIDDLTLNLKSKLTMTVHDENVLEVHESEIDKVPRQVKDIMEGAYEPRHIRLTSGMEWSAKSLADKVKGFPT
jgi:DNA polymerase I-like protein with 3'-5' exonuclease and polymerase domains